MSGNYWNNSRGQKFHSSIGGTYPVNNGDPQCHDEDCDEEEMVECPECKGTGESEHCPFCGEYQENILNKGCTYCKDSQITETPECKTCKGEGEVTETVANEYDEDKADEAYKEE